MKKVININFQGRVIPIEETAYEALQNYIASLRRYFDKEEGRDEIINDIESRIGELFGETLKKGAACITDADVDKVIASMGRPEDFEQADADDSGTASQSSGYSGASSSAMPGTEPAKKRLYRDEQDKILGGVASGMATYLGVDPAIIRLAFVLLAIFGGSGFLIYIILWIVLPSRSLVNSIRKRLYRDPDDKVIAGVCGGLGKYFDINPAIPRVIFAAPFILGIITSVGRHIFDPGFVFVGNSGGGTFILAYIILWIVLPEALTASEKLEMRGEKVDLNSIRDTVMSDLQGVKGRAQRMGNDIKETAERVGKDIEQSFAERGPQLGAEAGQAARRSSSGLGNAIAILIKAVGYLIGGAIAFGLFVALIALLGSGVGVMPLRDFLLQGQNQTMLAWGTLVFFIATPLVALLVWFVRRLMGTRAHSKTLGYGFSVLWTLGWFCVVFFAASMSRSFSSQVGKRFEVPLTQPSGNKLNIAVGNSNMTYYEGWFDFDGILSANRDSIYVNTVRVTVVKSKDENYHAHVVKISRGRDRAQAQNLAEKIEFPITQTDSVIYLPEAFSVSRNDKWRNQKVIVVIEVPVGKELRIDERVNDYDYFTIDFGRRNWRIDWDRGWEDSEYWEEGKNMKMTNDGLKWGRERNADRNDYRYRNNGDDWNSEEAKPAEQNNNSNAAPADSTKPATKPAKKKVVPAKPADTTKANAIEA